MKFGERMSAGGCFVIAEAGSNHDGDLERARRLIHVAAEAGADAVKFQLFTAAKLYAREAGVSDYLGSKESIYSIIERMELPPSWLPLLKSECNSRGIEFMASVFDEAALDVLDPYVTVHKCASYELTHHPLLARMAAKGKPLILSTGAADLEEVAEAVDVVRRAGGKAPVLLQCTASYPAPIEQSNLRAMLSMAERFGCLTGLSDHTSEPTIAPTSAVALGARVIEKHFTLDRTLPGPDHKFAIEPGELADMVSTIRAVERALGDGRKVPLPAETELRSFARRSLFAIRPIRSGDRFDESNVAALRCGKLPAGLAPARWEGLLGRKASRDVAPNVAVREEDVEGGTWNLRRATAEDVEAIWRWNNDPSVREVSRSTEPIPWIDHQRWFRDRLADRDTVLLVVETGRRSVGVVRLQKRRDASGVERAEVSIAIDSSARGAGVGRWALEQLCRSWAPALGTRELEAWILDSNVASRRAFESAGFEKVGVRDVDSRSFSIYRRSSGSGH